MKALVTGATGFLGSRVARMLSARGDGVRVLVRQTSDRRRIADLAIALAVGDVTDRESVARALDGMDVVYHCAALYELGARDRDAMERINVGGTRNVLEEATARDALSVHVSSVAALGPTGAEPVGESHRRHDEPRSAYEATKREAHFVAEELAAAGARVRIALPVTIYGPDDPSLVGTFHRIYVRGLVPVGFLPEMRMSLVHVDDCADGLVRIAEKGRDGEQYILSGQVVTFREWIEALARATGRRPPRVFLPGPVVRALAPLGAVFAPLIGLSRSLHREATAMSGGLHWAFTSEKAMRELGWEPRPLDAGIAETAAWYGAAEGPEA